LSDTLIFDTWSGPLPDDRDRIRRTEELLTDCGAMRAIPRDKRELPRRRFFEAAPAPLELLSTSVATVCWVNPERHPRLREATEFHLAVLANQTGQSL
jgi:hypothetical protein